MITKVIADVLKYPCNAICHQANCFHTMGSGVALQIKKKYPEAYEADIKHGKKGDRLRLGSMSVAQAKDGKYIYNVYGQYEYGTHKRQTNYEALYTGLELVKSHALDHDIKDLAVPYYMSSALAGGNWIIVESMFRALFEYSTINIIVCEYRPMHYWSADEMKKN
ncbi:MAG TPA: macro domain-containing protein [Bacteroidales bacterium]|nr:macro domain-containing protein [Bacteroidales bacterium]